MLPDSRLLFCPEFLGAFDIRPVLVRGYVRIIQVCQFTQCRPVTTDEVARLPFRVVGMVSQYLERRTAGADSAVEGVTNNLAATGRPQFVDVVAIESTCHDMHLGMVLFHIANEVG